MSVPTTYIAPLTNSLLHVDRPDGLEEAAWQAIDQPLQRLITAYGNGDLALVVGSAKEVAEAAAKVVLAARGETFAPDEAFGSLIGKAQKAIDRQPGEGLAADEPIRLAAQQAAKVVKNLGDLRNFYGTGHGRALAPEVPAEVASMSIEMTMMWCRWVLRRLAHVIFGRPQTLIALLSGGTFYRGDFTRRIESANLGEANPADQAALGLAVAHRAMSGTFLIMDEGVEACAQSSDLARWPMGYRYALVQGLMIDAQGHLDTSAWAIRQIGLLLSQMDDPAWILTVLEHQARTAWVSARLATPEKRYEVRNAMMMEAGRMPEPAAALWHKIMNVISPPPF